MLFVLLFFLLICSKSLFFKRVGIIKNKHKFYYDDNYEFAVTKNSCVFQKNNQKQVKNAKKLQKNVKKLHFAIPNKNFFAKRLDIMFGFLAKEKASKNAILNADKILQRLAINTPKNYDKNDLNKKAIFIHNFDKNSILLAKKYFDFNDVNSDKLIDLPQAEISEMQNKNLNYSVGEFMSMPTQKISFKNSFKIRKFDFQSYCLTVYKNANLEIAHYDYGDRDYLKFVCFAPSVVDFLYYKDLKDIHGELAIFEMQQNFVNIKTARCEKFFGFTHKPNQYCFSKIKGRLSKQNCVLFNYKFSVTKSFDIQFYLSEKFEEFVEQNNFALKRCENEFDYFAK